jgi:AbrB family looped-hinge helix DNA binding protein
MYGNSPTGGTRSAGSATAISITATAGPSRFIRVSSGLQFPELGESGVSPEFRELRGPQVRTEEHSTNWPGWRRLRTTVLTTPLVRRNLTSMNTTVSSKGQIVLPAELRDRDRIRPGERFKIERLEAGQYLLKKLPAHDNEGLVDWLLSCPEKGWFEPVPSESTDTL